jgi:Fe-S-cluster containining protein
MPGELNYNGEGSATGTITYPEQGHETAGSATVRKEKAEEISEKIKKAVKDFRETFECQRCGKCCQEGLGVALWPHEYNRIKKLDKHILRHITFINNWYALKLPCVFYDKKKHKCKIYNQRPIACQMYPLGVLPDGNTRISRNCPAVK